MRTLRMIGAAVIAVVLGVGLCACSDDDDNKINGNGNNGGTIKTENSVTLETAGTLSLVLGDKVQYITSLKITGPLNGDDIICLRQMLRCTDEDENLWGVLTVLDISDASIVKGGDSYYSFYFTSNNKIGSYMFYNCEGLETIVLPNSVHTIGYMAFYGCTGLTEVTIPNSVTTIGYMAFYGCTGLTSIYSLNPEPSTCSSSVYYNVDTSNCVLYVPEGAKDAYSMADTWKAFTNIEEIPFNYENGKEGSANSTESNGENDNIYSRVVIVYLVGENSLSSYAQSDLNEIRSAYSLISNDGAMVTYFDNSRTDVKPQILFFDNTMGETTQFEYGTDVISTDSATMLSVLKYIVDKNDADEYALIISSHGSGWIPATSSTRRSTIGVDNGKNSTSNTGEEMEICTLRGVLEALGVHWKYIMFDACFMQCIEVAYELRSLTDWCIASPAEIPGNGAAYDRLMPYFFKEDSYAKDIAEQYYDTYSRYYGVLISSIRSDQLELLASATAYAVSGLDSFPTSDLQQYCAYSSSTGWKPEYYDLGSCVYHWAGDSVYGTWWSALDAAIPYRYYTDTWLTGYNSTVSPVMKDGDHYAGASMYVPFEGRDELNAAWCRYEWYQVVGKYFDK